MSTTVRRQAIIRELLEKGAIPSQEKLQEMLKEVGIRAAQATLSRDLRDMGVVKGPRGYVLPGSSGGREENHGKGLGRTLASYLVNADHAECLAVLRTGPGQAQVVALEIDKAGIPGVLGTVAGDDTVFVAARTCRIAKRLVERLRAAAGLA